MIKKYKNILILFAFLTVLPVVLLQARPEIPAPFQSGVDFMSGDDSLVRLISAKKAKMMTIGGLSYRKIEGPALFLHNNTYLKCDEALWNVDSNYIDALGNVQIIQKETVLKSDQMHYYARKNLVQFRGSVVELVDKDTNTLRTRFLDYHTKDSVATFFGGGSMRDNEGKVIESIEGTYDSKTKVFSFENNVGMYADGMLAKTQRLDYNANEDVAYFRAKTYIWNDDNILVANRGSYNSNTQIIEFDNECCILTPAQEVQSDRLFYYRKTSEADLYGNVQIEDIEQKILMFGDYAYYAEEPFRAYLTQKPAFAMYGHDDDGRPDTLFMSADTLLLYKKRYREIDSMEIVRAEERLKLIDLDPIAQKEEEARQKAVPTVGKDNGQGGNAGPQRQQQNAGAQRGQQKSGQQNSVQRARQGGAQRQTGGVAGNARTGGGNRVQRPMAPSFEDYAYTGEPSVRPELPVQDTVNPEAQKRIQQARQMQQAQKAQQMQMQQRMDSSKTRMPVDRDSLMQAKKSENQALENLARRDSVLETAAPKVDSTSAGTAMETQSDSSAVVRDSIDLVRDTLQVTIMRAHNHVKIFRRNMQGCADSLIYTTLDSITRLYKKPILWNGPKYQFTADSMQVVVEHESLKKANLINSAFVISHEDSVFFNQIKSTEMTAFFEKNELVKFDALGGVNAIFYLRDNDIVSTMNQKEAKMMSVRFKEKDIERLKYYEDVKNNLISVVGLDTTKQKLRDFNWRIDERPYKRDVVTDRRVSKSERKRYAGIKMPVFSITDIYYDDYMAPILAGIHQGIADRKAARLAKKMKKTETTQQEVKEEIKKDIEERSVEKREKFVKSIVTEEKISYFTLYIKDKPKARLNNMELNRMKANVSDMFKEMKAEEKLRKKEMKRISKNKMLQERKSEEKSKEKKD